jgi:hypothetical protein
LAFAIENLSKDERIVFMLTKRSRGEETPSRTSDTALSFSRSMLHRYEVDWEANGFDEDALGELSEFCLRVLYSFVIDTAKHPRSGDNLRTYLARWVGPAVIYPRFADAMGAITKVAAPPPRSRRRSAS